MRLSTANQETYKTRYKVAEQAEQVKRQEFGLEELLHASAEVLGKGSTGRLCHRHLLPCARSWKLGHLCHRHLLPCARASIARNETYRARNDREIGQVESHENKDREKIAAP